MSFDSVHQTLINTGCMPDVHSFQPKAADDTGSVKQPSGFMPATDARSGRTVKPVKAQTTTKVSIFAFNTVKRDDYYLHGDLPAAETIRKLNEHAREAKLRTPEELAAKQKVKKIDQKLYQRLQGKRHSKADPALTTVTSTRPRKRVFRGDLKKLMKPLEGHTKAKEKFISNAERVANFPKTLRLLKTPSPLN